MLGQIFIKSQNKIQDPAKLYKLIALINAEQWVLMGVKDKGDIYEGLLDKNADKTIKNTYGATAYQTVATPFADAKSIYDMMGKMLEPMGLKLDYAYIEQTRPVIADMLK